MQFIFSLTRNVLSFNFKHDPSIILLQRPHLGSLHLLTQGCVLFSLTSDFIKMRLRFGSWRLPLMNLVFFIILFIVLSFLKIFIFSFNIPNTSLFFGLYVEINGVMFIPTSLCVFNTVFLVIAIAFKMPVLITWSG